MKYEVKNKFTVRTLTNAGCPTKIYVSIFGGDELNDGIHIRVLRLLPKSDLTRMPTHYNMKKLYKDYILAEETMCLKLETFNRISGIIEASNCLKY